MALLDSIGDPALAVGAGSMAIQMKHRAGEMADILRWSQTVIDWADGDPTKGPIPPGEVQVGWNGVVANGQHGLDETRDTGRRLQMTNIRLHRPNEKR